MKDKRKPAQSNGTASASRGGFTDEEKAAMKDRVKEMRRGPKANDADVEAEVLAKIAEMPEADRRRGERIHALIKARAPHLTPRLWYGMPAYAKDGKTICFFQNASKFKMRYAMLGFSDNAKLDDGTMWPVYYALTELTKADEARIAALIEQAAS